MYREVMYSHLDKLVFRSNLLWFLWKVENILWTRSALIFSSQAWRNTRFSLDCETWELRQLRFYNTRLTEYCIKRGLYMWRVL